MLPASKEEAGRAFGVKKRQRGRNIVSQGIPLQSSEQSQKTKSQSLPGPQNENGAFSDLPLKARSQGYARSWHPGHRAHLPCSLAIPVSALWAAGSRSPSPLASPAHWHSPR